MADDTKLGPQPDPVVEPGEPNPGGADAVDETPAPPLPRDLGPEGNPAVEDVLPEAVAEPDDKSQAPEGKAADHESGTESGTESEPQAGQEAEDGSVEPPA
ncbi:hypothetical protein [Nocardioides sp. LHG3406-4]|uniref:hypothetical protein n=1 Tax=Nocardioides sp. LHG3406-4 TaxID=2804575 RepID=UPI003CE6F4B9